MRKLKPVTINFAVLLGSIVIFLAFCEFIVFRFIWLASDIPRLDFVSDVVRFAPHQSGVRRLRDEVAAPFAINAQGWNSGIGDYSRERRPGVARVAMVGDSFVEGLHVANTASLAEVLGRTITADRRPTEVHRFAISGAPLSQYVHMVEREVLGYRPDWIVVVVIHNDFDESFRFVQGRYTSSFMKFKVADGKVVTEIPPTPWRPDALEFLRQTATARFLLYRWQVRPQALVDFFLPAPAQAASRIAAWVEIDRILALRREVEAVADHSVTRLAALSRGIGARLLLVMDSDRPAIESGSADSPAHELNRILAAAAARHGVEFLDLHPVFAAHWAMHRRRFEFNVDGHWNELGHSIVAAAIAERIREAR